MIQNFANLEKKLNGNLTQILENMDEWKSHLNSVPVRNKYDVLKQVFIENYNLSQREFKQLYGKTKKLE